MDEHKLRTFNAIASFVQDLNSGFGKKYKPVALYNRLVEKTTLQDSQAVDRHIKAFKLFFQNNPQYVQEKKFGDSTRIVYSDRVYLDIGVITNKSDATALSCIHRHLVTIYSLLNVGTRESQQALEALNSPEGSLDIQVPDTTEGNFIKNTLGEMTSHFQGMEETGGNPMQMIMGMMQSGFFTKFMGDMQEKFSKGEMDIQSLMNTVTSVINQSTPEGSPESEQIKNLVNSTIQATANGGQGLPPEMGQLLSAFTGGLPGMDGLPGMPDLQNFMNTAQVSIVPEESAPENSPTPES